MEVRSTLKPGVNGTKTLQAIYGKRLLFVRYRYDKSQGRRYKTVELIIDEQPWCPARE